MIRAIRNPALLIIFSVATVACASLAGAKEPLPANAQIYDVRTSEEFAREHISGAINVPYDQIPERLSEFPKKDDPIVVYCRSGRRSGIAKKTLEAHGFTRVVNGGGLSDMKKRLKGEGG